MVIGAVLKNAQKPLAERVQFITACFLGFPDLSNHKVLTLTTQATCEDHPSRCYFPLILSLLTGLLPPSGKGAMVPRSRWTGQSLKVSLLAMYACPTSKSRKPLSNLQARRSFVISYPYITVTSRSGREYTHVTSRRSGHVRRILQSVPSHEERVVNTSLACSCTLRIGYFLHYYHSSKRIRKTFRRRDCNFCLRLGIEAEDSSDQTTTLGGHTQ